MWQMEGAETPYNTENGCDHSITFDSVAAEKMSKWDIRKKWPRLYGLCPKGCGFNGIAYASFEHFLYGDW